MAIQDTTKIDLLLKKLYGVTKTDTAGNKSPSNEAISSPLLIRGDTIWTQANSIPSTAGVVTGVVQSYLSTSKIQCTADTTSQLISGIFPTWRTNLTNWISPEFDTVNLTNTYRVRVYYGNTGLADPATSGGTQIFADGSGNTGEWYFDYQSGVLHFLGGTPPTGMTGSHTIYIYGYRYVGSTTINSLVAPIDTNISFTTSGTGIVQINSDVEIDGTLTLTGQTSIASLNVEDLTDGRVVLAGINGELEDSGNLTFDGTKLTVTGDIELSGDLTTSSSTFNLINTTANTVNFAGAATDIQIGATTGTTNINNDLDVDGNANIDGGNITTNQTSFNVFNGTATTVQAFGAAETLVFASSTGTTTFRSDVVINNDLQIKGGDLTTNSSTFNLINDTATTVNFAGNAFDLNVSRVGGTTTVLGDLQVDGNTEIIGNLTIGGNLTLGNQDTDTITVTADFTSDLVPDVTNTYDLGTVSKQWQSVFANSINFTEIDNGTIKISGNVIETIVADTDLELKPAADGRVVINSTTALRIPKGTEVERPNPAEVGDVRFNTDSARVENYNGDQWNTMTNEDDAIAFAIALG